MPTRKGLTLAATATGWAAQHVASVLNNIDCEYGEPDGACVKCGADDYGDDGCTVDNVAYWTERAATMSKPHQIADCLANADYWRRMLAPACCNDKGNHSTDTASGETHCAACGERI